MDAKTYDWARAYTAMMEAALLAQRYMVLAEKELGYTPFWLNAANDVTAHIEIAEKIRKGEDRG